MCPCVLPCKCGHALDGDHFKITIGPRRIAVCAGYRLLCLSGIEFSDASGFRISDEGLPQIMDCGRITDCTFDGPKQGLAGAKIVLRTLVI